MTDQPLARPIPRDAHLGTCTPPPAHRRRWRDGRLWICPRCGQAWVTTRRQPSNIAPTVISWWWRKWPFEEDY